MHALEIGSAGQVAFASREVPAWHLLGTVFNGEVSTAEMLDIAYLSKWGVRLIEAPTEYTTPEGEVVSLNAVQDAFYVIRDNPFNPAQVDRLSIVGARYKVYQNEDLFAFGDALLDGGGLWETAGSIKDGRQVFGSLLLPREIVIDGEGANDKVKTYLVLHTSHDGSAGIQAVTSPIRVECQNLLNIALRGAKQSFKVRHTQKMEGRIAEAKKALEISYKYADTFEKEANALFQKSCNNKEFFEIVTNLYPQPDDEAKGAMTRWENKVGLLGDLFAGVETIEGAPITNANITGTAWGALNALTERLDWYRTPRGGDVTALAESASGFNPVINAEKARIKDAVFAFAKEKENKVLISV